MTIKQPTQQGEKRCRSIDTEELLLLLLPCNSLYSRTIWV